MGGTAQDSLQKSSDITRGEQLTCFRLKKLQIGKELKPEELDLHEILYNREAAIGLDSSEKGRYYDLWSHRRSRITRGRLSLNTYSSP